MKTELSDMNHETHAGGASAFVIRHSSSVIRRLREGAAMLATLMFALAGTIVITAWISLLGARLQQSERMGVEVQRHTIWGNTRAINQQYAFTWAMRDNVTRSLSSATLSGWGGSDADSFTAFQAFRSSVRPSSTTTTSYPFNNIRNTPTSDSGVFFARTTADSDSSQTEHLSFFNYFKTYPSSLLGDLLVIHKKNTSAGNDYYFSDNIQVNGRVVIWDPTAQTENLRAESSINLTKTGTNTVRNTAVTPAEILPQNFASSVATTAGYGGSGTPTAVSNGTLNLINNGDFAPGSVRHIMEATGTAGSTWMNCTTGSNTSTNIETDSASGSSTSAVQVKLEGTVTYALPTTSPYGYTKSGNLNVLIARLRNASLKHLRVTSGVEQLVLEGQTNTSDYNAAGALDPVIIWLEQADCRDIRFIGENNRPLILATGRGNGATLYSAFHGTSLVAGGPLRWRLHWINEYRLPYLHVVSSGVNVQLIGGIRTDWALYTTDSGSNVRFTLTRETSPGDLETMLPRDGWLEPYVLVR
jgi:hypothetical protein